MPNGEYYPPLKLWEEVKLVMEALDKSFENEKRLRKVVDDLSEETGLLRRMMKGAEES